MDLREQRELASTAGNRHPWELARVEVIEHLLRSQLGRRQPALILDVGCGDAFVAEQLSLRYPTAHIVAVDTELDEETLAQQRERLAGRPITLHQSLKEAASQPATADVVLLLDVIEHIADDVSFLRELRSCPLIAPQTLLLITAPAHQSLYSAHDVFLKHFRRYHSRLLEEHLAQSGFRALSSGYFFWTALLFRMAQVGRERLFRGRVPRAVGLAGWQGGPLATRAVQLMLQTDFACSRILRRLGIRLPGLSNYALCKTSAS